MPHNPINPRKGNKAAGHSGPAGPECDDHLEATVFAQNDPSIEQPTPQSTIAVSHKAHETLRSMPILDPGQLSVPEFAGGPLAALPRSLQRALREKMTPVQLERNEILLEQGSPADGLFVVTAGTLRIESTTDSGQTRPLARVGAGHVVGEMSLIGVTSRTASAVACEPVEALRLSANDFHQLRQAHAEIAQVITEIVASRLGTDAHDALSAKLLNGYRIGGRLGRGGQSVVYEAEQIATSRRVALKMMSHRLVYEEHARELFDSEARIVSEFSHPNIPRVYDRFDEFGTSFMVIEFIEGLPLSEIRRNQTTLPEKSLQAIAGQLAGALAYAHDRGIVHRDVKPANCMLAMDGTVKLLDFGLSVFFSTHRNPEGCIVGTLAYMAPELVAGQPPTPAADWFSLGVMLYELATGKRLIQPRNLLQLSGLFRNWDPAAIVADLPEESFLRPLLMQLLQADPFARSFDLGALLRLARPVTET